MPIRSCTLPEGGSGFRWGQHGKCYADRADAERQEAAARANGWAGDEEMRTLYVSRKVTNPGPLLEWALAQGFTNTLPADDLHVTIAFSKAPLHWSAAGDSFDTVRASDASEDAQQRAVAQLGAQGAVVLKFDNPDLRRRWQEFRDAGASWDWPDYKPHVTITYETGDVDLLKVQPYTGPIEFGPEVFAEVDEDWVSKVKGAADEGFSESDHPRAENGQFGAGGGGSPAAKQTPENDPAMVNIPLSKRGNINAQLDKHKAEQARAAEEKRKADSAERKTDKATAKELLTKHSDAIHARFDAKFGRKELTDLLDQWAKWEPKKLIAFASKFERESAAGKDWGMDELMRQVDKLAFDRATVRTYDQDGRLRVEMTNISKAAVNPYLGSEIPDGESLGLDPKKVYQLLRDPEELAKAAETFNGVPLLNTHVPSTAWDHPSGKVVGTTGTDAVFEAPYLKNSLIVWTADAIQGIESGEQRELSCGYRYRADMTPGTYDGVQHDGVMRDIRGNHVCLVQAGRAGPDVVVGDSQLETKEKGMTKKALSSKAQTARGALLATLKPLLAADAKMPDLPAILQGVTAKNWKDSKAKIVAAIKPKIAADADIQEIVKLLDSLDDIEDAQDEPAAADPNAAAKPAVDADPMEELSAMLKGKVDDATLSAVLEKCKAMMAKPAAAADADEPDNKDMVSKTAMDAALKKASEDSAKAIKLASDAAAKDAEQRTIARLQEIDGAREFAKSIVGTLSGAFDSAEAVYRAALDVKGVKHHEVKDVAALRLILEAQPKPGAQLAHDARHTTPQGFAERFPGAVGVRTV